MRTRIGLAAVLVLPLLAVPASAQSTGTFEAEDGALDGVVVESSVPGFSGTGYVAGFDTGTDQVTITIPDSPGGLHDLAVRYAAPYGSKNTTLRLNGSGMGELHLPETAAFTTAAAGQVLLRPGDNTVTLVNNWGWYLIDAISVAPSPPPPPHQVTGELTDPAATPEAKGLMRYLASQYGRNILSGQQDMASIAWVEENVGASPAIAGLDLMDYSPSRVERGTTSREVENAIAWDARGGVVTMAWHWNAPSGLIDQPGKEWWRGFYTDATTFDLAAALDPASADHALLLRDIDAIAVQLRRLSDAGVPVLWRPLHEAEGGWFWWGAKGPGPAKQLYRLLHERLSTHHDLHNLVWVWNSVAPEWYPGDDVVDVVSVDSYPPIGDHGPLSNAYTRLVELGGDRKLVVLGEVGGIPDPELTRAYRADWSWFVTWSGSFIQDGITNPLDFLRRVYTDPHVLTLDELGDFKRTPATCGVTQRVVARWGTGFHVEVTVTNPLTAPTRSWSTRWTLPEGSRVTQTWSAKVTTEGRTVTATNQPYNGTVKPGATTTFGYLGTGQPPTATASCTARD
ncbi:glycosyl hydrolase [Actinokineospora sp. 24-640]